MTLLRQKVIEAGARAMRLQEYGVDGPLDDVSKQKAEPVVDAMLDCLIENLDDRDRWVDVAANLREDR